MLSVEASTVESQFKKDFGRDQVDPMDRSKKSKKLKTARTIARKRKIYFKKVSFNFILLLSKAVVKQNQ
jgi:hypothetical protein